MDSLMAELRNQRRPITYFHLLVGDVVGIINHFLVSPRLRALSDLIEEEFSCYIPHRYLNTNRIKYDLQYGLLQMNFTSADWIDEYIFCHSLGQPGAPWRYDDIQKLVMVLTGGRDKPFNTFNIIKAIVTYILEEIQPYL